MLLGKPQTSNVLLFLYFVLIHMELTLSLRDKYFLMKFMHINSSLFLYISLKVEIYLYEDVSKAK